MEGDGDGAAAAGVVADVAGVVAFGVEEPAVGAAVGVTAFATAS